jgi:hypothetical protein
VGGEGACFGAHACLHACNSYCSCGPTQASQAVCGSCVHTWGTLCAL